MPFPLAHPAAVMPLRRLCPRFLNFPALVLGSLVPDAGYCFGGLKVEDFSHRLGGMFGFSLPLGLLLVLALYALRARAIAPLPDRLQRVFLPERWQPLGSPVALVLSLLLGIATHLLLDSFTHRNGWFVERLPLLRAPVLSLAGHTAKVCTVLWYFGSFVGVAWLTLAYYRRQRGPRQHHSGSVVGADWSLALVVALLVLPIELVHHLVHGRLGPVLVAFCSLLLVLGTGLRIVPSPAPQQPVSPGPTRRE